MSRGMGHLQRRVISILADHPAGSLPVAEIKARLDTDRSNARRAIRTLIRRGKIEEFKRNGERQIRLDSQYDPLAILGKALDGLDAEDRGLREEKCRQERYRARMEALAAARAEEQRRWKTEIAAGRGWILYEYRFARRRCRGPVQTRVLYALWEYSCPSLNEGLPVPVLKAIVGGDKSNVRRAIRTMLMRGELEEREDRKRIRLSARSVILLNILSPLMQGIVDDGRAKAVLRDAGEVVA